MANSKIIYFGETLMDLTQDTVEASKMLEGTTAHGADGEEIVGTCTYDADTSDANAKDSEILAGKTAYVGGTKKTGSMKNNGAVNGTISTKTGKYTVPQGFHDGSGKVEIDLSEQAKLIPANIRAGVTVLGVTGEMSSTEGANPQAKTVTASNQKQEVLPDAGYNYLSQVTVNPVTYAVSDNNAGGKTVTIG